MTYSYDPAKSENLRRLLETSLIESAVNEATKKFDPKLFSTKMDEFQSINAMIANLPLQTPEILEISAGRYFILQLFLDKISIQYFLSISQAIYKESLPICRKTYRKINRNILLHIISHPFSELICILFQETIKNLVVALRLRTIRVFHSNVLPRSFSRTTT